jgi:hypothetical protein
MYDSGIREDLSMAEYRQIDSISTPNDSAVIRRYIDFTKFVSLLEEQALYFARVDKLSVADPFEGSYASWNLAADQLSFEQVKSVLESDSPVKDERSWKQFKANRKWLRSLIRAQQSRTFVNCWHIGGTESAAMWRLYVTSGAGIAIESTVGRLKQSITRDLGDHFVFIGTVKYIDYANQFLPENDFLIPFFHKRLSFEHEKELRAAIQLGRVEAGRDAFTLGVDVDTLISGVRVTPSAEAWFADLVRKMTARYGLKIEVRQSDLSARPLE